MYHSNVLWSVRFGCCFLDKKIILSVSKGALKWSTASAKTSTLIIKKSICFLNFILYSLKELYKLQFHSFNYSYKENNYYKNVILFIIFLLLLYFDQQLHLKKIFCDIYLYSQTMTFTAFSLANKSTNF